MVQRPQTYNGCMQRPFTHSPTDTGAHSGVTVVQRPWPLAKGNGFILDSGVRMLTRHHPNVSSEVIRIGPKISKPEPICPAFRFWGD